MKKVLILGATGSIGTSALKIISEFPDKFVICGLTAHTNKEALSAIAEKYKCSNFCLTGTPDGEEALQKVIDVSGADIAVNGIAGSAGLMASVKVLERGIDLALANKETIVMASPLVYALADKTGAHILPVDSEHSAIFTLIQHYGRDSVSKIVLTASGGTFKTLSRGQLSSVTVADALKHPTWNMGKKITIDSATLANKGLEVIEACRLFGAKTDDVIVTIHPQSLVHSLIQTKDGVLYAQISPPDMQHPILQALTWPEFYPNSLKKLDLAASLTEKCEMTFSAPDKERFPMLALAYKAAGLNGGYTIAYNAANEIAVDLFARGAARFYDISDITSSVLEHDWTREPSSFNDVLEIDALARRIARKAAASLTGISFSGEDAQ